MNQSARSRRLIAGALLAGTWLWMARAHVESVDLPFLDLKSELHQQVIENRAPDPYQYKLWTIANTFEVFRGRGVPLAVIFVANSVLSLGFLVACHHLWLTAIASGSAVLVGDLLLAALANILFLGYYHHPYEFWGVGFFCLMLRALAMDRGALEMTGWGLATGLLWEKHALVPFVWTAGRWHDRANRFATLAKSAMVLASCLAVPLALRALLGGDRPEVDGMTTLARQKWAVVLIAQLPLVFPFLAIFAARFSRMPRILRLLWLYLPVLVVAYLSQRFILQETRSFWALVPVFTATTAVALGGTRDEPAP